MSIFQKSIFKKIHIDDSKRMSRIIKPPISPSFLLNQDI